MTANLRANLFGIETALQLSPRSLFGMAFELGPLHVPFGE
jgi:hypothetical protein